MIPDRYSIENLKKAIKNPKLFMTEIYQMHRNFSDMVVDINSFYLSKKFGPGVDVMKNDWDNLIILDACRYDFFKDCINSTSIDGILRKEISSASQSWEFMQKNFSDRQLHDTVYVTANPHIDLLSENIFYTVYPLLDQWDQELKTVPPEDIVKTAIRAHKNHPKKRLIIHFMQPHLPFLGETAKRIRSEYPLKGFNNYEFRDGHVKSGHRWYHYVEKGEISISETRKAYRETLEITLEHVSDLLGEINGKSVITSDHGENLGERVLHISKRRFGHLGWENDVYICELREIPWFEVMGDDRRKSSTEDPIGYEELGDEVVQERLRSLGYV